MIFIEEKKQLKDICQFIYGKSLPKPKRNKGDFLVYGSWWITDFHDDYLIQGPWIIVWRKWTIWSVYYSKQNFFPIDTVFYVEPFEGVDLKFLYYKLQTLWLEKLNSDAAVPWLNRNDALSVELSIPPLPTQQRIASILSNYDDLIENNTRRIEILEEQAQALYRHRFVDFKFPWNEQVKLVDSETEFGIIPEGWEVKEIKSILKLLGWYAFKWNTYKQWWIYWVVTIKNVMDWKFIEDCSNAIDDLPDNLKDYQHLVSWDILLSLTGNVWRVCIVYGNSYLLNQRVAKVSVYEDFDYTFAYCLFRSQQLFDRMNMIAKWVAQQNLSPVETEELQIVMPSLELRINFSWKCNKILQEIINLHQQNSNLKKQRDLLLPRLMSGEILVD